MTYSLTLVACIVFTSALVTLWATWNLRSTLNYLMDEIAEDRKALVELLASTERTERHAEVVASELAASQGRADAIHGVPGEAADAASQSGSRG